MDLIGQRQASPFVRQHFHQVTWLEFRTAQGDAEFFVLEFRNGQHAALVWETLLKKWAAGRWVTLSHPGADITCPPSPIAGEYLPQAVAFESLDAALKSLSESMPSSNKKSWAGAIRRFWQRGD